MNGTILDALREVNLDFDDLNKPSAPKWDRSRMPLLVCRVDTAKVYHKEKQTEVDLTVTNWDGATYTIYHRAYSSYAFCRAAAIRTGKGWDVPGWSSELSDAHFAPLLGRTLIIRYKGQSEDKGQPHLFDVFMGEEQDDLSVLAYTYSIITEKHPDWAEPVLPAGVPASDEDL